MYACGQALCKTPNRSALWGHCPGVHRLGGWPKAAPSPGSQAGFIRNRKSSLCLARIRNFAWWLFLSSRKLLTSTGMITNMMRWVLMTDLLTALSEWHSLNDIAEGCVDGTSCCFGGKLSLWHLLSCSLQVQASWEGLAARYLTFGERADSLDTFEMFPWISLSFALSSGNFSG